MTDQTRLSDPDVVGSPRKSDGEQDLTTSNKILVVAYRLSDTRETFTAEDLIVEAWKEFPESFGLAGYRELYPDSNRVLSKLMGAVGLCSRGWLEQVSTKTYKITPNGRKFAHALRTAPADARRVASDAGRASTAPSARNSTVPAAGGRASVPPSSERKSSVPAAADRKSTTPAEPAASAKGDRKSSVPAVSAAPVASAPASAKGDRKSSVPAASAAPTARVSNVPAEPKSEKAAARASNPAPEPKPVAAREVPKAAPPAPPPAAPIAVAANGVFDGIPALARLATSVASQKFTRGALVTFQDACQFWAINASTHPRHLAVRLDEIATLLKRAEAHIAQTGTSIHVNERTDLTLTTVIGLQGLHRMLTQRYNRELENIRARAGGGDDDDDE